MTLEVSTWTRRDRIERIATAERDRRAGRLELALASLGEPVEWPARIVQALTHLDDAEGAEARRLLEATLDDWALESGLGPLTAESEPVAEPPILSADEAALDTSEDILEEALPVVDPEDTGPNLEGELELAPLAREEAASLPGTSDSSASFDETSDADDSILGDPYIAADRRASSLDSPIELDELERAFAEAEAQTDEMLDVNSVAERVLMDEPTGLSELDDEPLDAAIAESPVWPEAYDVSPGDTNSPVVGIVESVVDAASVPEMVAEPNSSRATVIATLEQWLVNLETNRTGRAR